MAKDMNFEDFRYLLNEQHAELVFDTPDGRHFLISDSAVDTPDGMPYALLRPDDTIDYARDADGVLDLTIDGTSIRAMINDLDFY